MEFFWASGSTIGLVGDIRDILNIYNDDSDLGSLVPTFKLMDHAFPKKFLKSAMVTAFNRIDFETSRAAVTRSALVSTGQAEGMRRIAVTGREYCKVLPQLTNPLYTAPERCIFYQVLVGCDFITPFSYRKRPKCCLCGAPQITTQHLVLECPEVAVCDGNSGILLVERILARPECPPVVREILERQVSEGAKTDLFYTLMGVVDPQLFQTHKYYFNSMLKITANRLLHLKSAWIDGIASRS